MKSRFTELYSWCDIKDGIPLERTHQGEATAAMVKVISLVLEIFVCDEN
jgi:hypothetical protein